MIQREKERAKSRERDRHAKRDTDEKRERQTCEETDEKTERETEQKTKIHICNFRNFFAALMFLEFSGPVTIFRKNITYEMVFELINELHL